MRPHFATGDRFGPGKPETSHLLIAVVAAFLLHAVALLGAYYLSVGGRGSPAPGMVYVEIQPAPLAAAPPAPAEPVKEAHQARVKAKHVKAEPARSVVRPKAAQPEKPKAAFNPQPVSVPAGPVAISPEHTKACTCQTCPCRQAASPSAPVQAVTAPGRAPEATAAAPALSQGGVESPVAQAVPAAKAKPGSAGGPGMERARARYLETLKAMIEKYKDYPVMARRGRVEGTSVIRFVLARSGRMKNAVILRSSGSGLLDNAALRAVREVGGFPPLPPEINGQEVPFDVPITFRLSDV
jgi:protein TonB